MKNAIIIPMTYTVSITSQGQLSIPTKLRRTLGFTNKALVSVADGKVVLEPIVDLLDLKGAVQPRHPAPAQPLRQAFEAHLAANNRDS